MLSRYDWHDIEASENEADYQDGYRFGISGNALPLYVSDIFEDGYKDGLAEREHKFEEARQQRAERDRERRFNRKADPYRVVKPIVAAAPILRKRAP